MIVKFSIHDDAKESRIEKSEISGGNIRSRKVGERNVEGSKLKKK